MENHQRNILASYVIFGISGLALYYIPSVKSIFFHALFYLPWIIIFLFSSKIRSNLKEIFTNRKDQLIWSLKSGTLEALVTFCSIKILTYPLGAENLVLSSMWPLFMFLTTVALGLEPRSKLNIFLAFLFGVGLFLIKKDEFINLSLSLGTLFVLIRVLMSTYGSIFNKKSVEVHDCTFDQWLALVLIRWIPVMIVGLISFVFYENITLKDFTTTNVLFYLINALIGGILAHSLILNGIKAVSFFELLSFSTVGRIVTILGFIILGKNELTSIKILGIFILLFSLVTEKYISSKFKQ